ncbi:MAG: arsenosugar biosynthesis radical SAM protein ArsS [Gammaproteobacteria bacterium]|nr:arsenosugar biosynthesis radical SAM protein ArsS [Gammaproteobacteria bacterium]
MHATLPLLEVTDFPQLKRARLQTLQVNLGYLCNQQCLHCHVNAGPRRTEIMQRETVECVIDYLRASTVCAEPDRKIGALDLTGGAPEMNPHFRDLVRSARALGVHVIDRCNLTILEQPDYAGMAEFLAGQQVEITASLPCYLEDNVDAQRGKGVFDASIHALRRLNALGYGREASGLMLNLVYNPQGTALPPPQHALERDYKKYLGERHDVVFNQLFTLANMPIQRFGSMLVSKGQFENYMNVLRAAHRDSNLDNVMCRSLISVDWQGYVYDCDFNQMLNLPLRINGKPRVHLSHLKGANLEGRPIVVKDHCYGCTAGQGSSCGGALNEEESYERTG